MTYLICHRRSSITYVICFIIKIFSLTYNIYFHYENDESVSYVLQTGMLNDFKKFDNVYDNEY